MNASFYRLRASERGAIMIEGLMVYLITLTLLGLMLALYNLYYQRWNIQTVANESAMRIGQTYKYPTADVTTGKVSKDDLSSRNIYRYLPLLGDNSEQEAKEHLESYALRRLSKTTFAAHEGELEESVSIVVKQDAIARRWLKVTISGTYRIPFGELLSLVGGQGTVTYTVTSYAQCVDLSDYLSTVRYASDAASARFVSGSVTKLLDSVLGLIDTIFG